MSSQLQASSDKVAIKFPGVVPGPGFLHVGFICAYACVLCASADEEWRCLCRFEKDRSEQQQGWIEK